MRTNRWYRNYSRHSATTVEASKRRVSFPSNRLATTCTPGHVRWFGSRERLAARGASRRLALEPGGDQIPDRVGEILLVAKAEFGHHAVRGDHGRGVLIASERLVDTDLVQHDQVGTLPRQLCAGVREAVVRLGGERDKHLAVSLLRTELGRDVRIDGELDRFWRTAVSLFDLVVLIDRRPEVGGRGGHDEYVRIAGQLERRVAQLERGRDAYEIRAGRIGKRHVRRDDGHARATGDGGACERVTLLAGAS